MAERLGRVFVFRYIGEISFPIPQHVPRKYGADRWRIDFNIEQLNTLWVLMALLWVVELIVAVAKRSLLPCHVKALWMPTKCEYTLAESRLSSAVFLPQTIVSAC